VVNDAEIHETNPRSHTKVRGDVMEKRKHQRVPFHAEATVKNKGTVISGKVDNLSMRGMFLNTEARLTDNDQVDITILLTGSSTQLSIDLTGTVVRQTETGIAVLFKEMDLDSFIHLRNVVSYNSTDADEVMDEYLRSIESRPN
jgi:ribosomal protein S1